jgi:protein SCO1/2
MMRAMARGRWIASLVAVGLLGDGGVGARARKLATLPVLGELPPFSYLDQDGHRVSNVDLLGHTLVVDFIFTHCTTACPMLSAKMVMLQRKIRGSNVTFVSFSVDPAHDTPAALKDYAARWGADETRWRLLSTDARTLAQTVAKMGAILQRTGDPADPILHSSGFLLIDAGGLIRGTYDSDDGTQLMELVADLGRLASHGPKSERAAQAPEGAGTSGGAKLFVQLGCQGCHGQAQIAAPLGGLFGTQVTLTDGRKVKVDAAYLRESILDPAAKVAVGYPATMPSYAGQLSPVELASLVDYLKTLGPEPAASKPRTVAVDPVCKMELSVGPDTLTVEHGSERYHFCSEACRDKFKRDPAKYVPK